MQLKDYYKILEVTPLATQQEIKRSFRRLALKYHPDKNEGSPLSEAMFKEIQEAWAVLSDPKQREEYNYKRWFNRSIGGSYTERPLTPAAIQASAQQLKDYVVSMNIFQIDFDALSFHIRQLLNDSNIGILHQFNDVSTNRTISKTLLQTAEPLPLKYLQPIALLLAKLAGNDEPIIRTIDDAVQERKRRELWEQYKWVVVVVVTALICWLMFKVGSST